MGGPSDSPPSTVGNRVVFGSADGRLYCLRASDGELAWCHRAARRDERMVANGRLESVWPLHGSTLILGDTVYFTAGRSSYLNGGMTLGAVDLHTGEIKFERTLFSRDPKTGAQPEDSVAGLEMPRYLPDVLFTDGQHLFLRDAVFNLDGQPLDTGRSSAHQTKRSGKSAQGKNHAEKGTEIPHLYCPRGFLDDTWWHRTYWLYGTHFYSGAGGWPKAGREFPSGRILVADNETIYGYGRQMKYYRWTTPNEGWATIEKIIDTGSVPRIGDDSGRPGVFTYQKDSLNHWNVDAGVWLQGYWCFDWYEETIKVKSINREERQITLARPSLYGIKQGNPSPRRYRALNVLEELDQPGEYYIDRASGRLYFWPPSELTDARIALSTLNGPLLVLQDTANIVLRDFIVEAGLGDGIEVNGGHHVRIEACEVRNTRKLGIRVDGGQEHCIAGCNIHRTGTGGLFLGGGDRKTLTPAGHEAINNHIWRFSEHQLTYASGVALSGVGNRAAHNRIHDAPHMAIGVHGNDHVFELNIVHDVCTASDDAGALYKGRNPSCRGNVIRYNFWRDIGSPMGHGTAAVYFDDGDGGETVFGNIFLRCGYPGRGSFGTVFSHGGHGNVAENNIFIDCKRALGSAPWNFERWKTAVEGGGGCHWQERLLEEVDITKPPYATHYAELVGFMNPQPDQVRINRAKNNVLVRCDEISSGNWQYKPEQMWTTDSDPGFVDADNGNYQLRSDAEVFQHLTGFRPIPFDKIGPQEQNVAQD